MYTALILDDFEGVMLITSSDPGQEFTCKHVSNLVKSCRVVMFFKRTSNLRKNQLLRFFWYLPLLLKSQPINYEFSKS